jgi:hypothetical protein
MLYIYYMLLVFVVGIRTSTSMRIIMLWFITFYDRPSTTSKLGYRRLATVKSPIARPCIAAIQQVDLPNDTAPMKQHTISQRSAAALVHAKCSTCFACSKVVGVMITPFISHTIVLPLLSENQGIRYCPSS